MGASDTAPRGRMPLFHAIAIAVTVGIAAAFAGAIIADWFVNSRYAPSRVLMMYEGLSSGEYGIAKQFCSPNVYNELTSRDARFGRVKSYRTARSRTWPWQMMTTVTLRVQRGRSEFIEEVDAMSSKTMTYASMRSASDGSFVSDTNRPASSPSHILNIDEGGKR